jgi:hypothetical protein
MVKCFKDLELLSQMTGKNFSGPMVPLEAPKLPTGLDTEPPSQSDAAAPADIPSTQKPDIDGNPGYTEVSQEAEILGTIDDDDE